MSKKTPFLFLIIFLGISTSGFAQFTFKPMSESTYGEKSNLRISETENDSTQIELPFWDDFSQSAYLPDTAQWFIDAGTTNISGTVGVDPPTVNVAVFDGWNAQGTPYSTIQLASGAGDSLVSRYIDMTVINPALRETVYLSFYWEKEGRGEIPDDTDSIALQLMDRDNRWTTVWSKTGKEVESTNIFFPENIKVSDESYFHPYFQFRFLSFGNLSGGFDTWLIDYVYMNYNRSADDMVFQDRALTNNPTSWLTQYSAMPYNQFIVNLNQNLEPTRVGVHNLDNQVQAIEYSALIQDSVKIYDEMNAGTPINLAPLERTFFTSEPIDPDAFDSNNDSLSLILETKFFINSGDSSNWLNKFDLRVNDTTTSTTLLETQLAYDDGSAEWAAGLSEESALLAYRFIIPVPDAITAVNIYFPDFSPSSAGKTFSLIVWDNLFLYQFGRLITEQQTVVQTTELNEYVTYTLGRPVAVADTFYVGYEQNVDDFFPIGLDKNGKPHEGNIFMNLDGVWEPATDIDGNLMIRPVFGFKKAVGLEEELFKGLKIFPNPNNGIFNVRGEFDKAVLLDFFGNRILEIVGRDPETEIKLNDQKSGLYFLKVFKEGKFKTFKIIVNE